ncbi:tetratricopeptide repeat protein [Caulobacter sp. SLTY]|uniref:tetratricopeptide repeat protein n=1 Tax=Caulobacter sp. SLTY TaxID=2683262 RepID=UPI001411E6FA|nr:tetratricopeptide repeat protein [Caulobacter sp. SLTY]NBB14014.1 tetratricopeptide repeat protein [Caulobacter sp. SLTY]
MVSRLIGLMLGLLIAAAGWIIVRPLGEIGPALPVVDLAQFEGLRALIGWGALALGGLAVVVNLWPGRDKPRRRAASGPSATITFADDPPAPQPVANPAPERPLQLIATPIVTPTAATATAEPLVFAPGAPAPTLAPVPPAPVTVAPVAQKPLADGPAQETFGQLREMLRGKVRAEAWGEAGQILQRLPKLALTHRDRMAAAQDLGDFCRSQGRVEDASEAYGQALSYARLLHEIEPADPVGASDLAGALVSVGDMAADEGRLDAALGAYEEAVSLRRRLVADHGARRLDRRALSLALERLADAREDRGHRVRALDLYRESAEIAGALAAEDPQRYGADLQGTRTRLSELEARLSV